MLRLYTEEYFIKGKIKRLVKKILGRYMRGPQAAVLSLVSGLKEIGADFTINKLPQKGDVCGVLNGTDVLLWAIEQKKQGIFRTLIAGPNIVVHPSDYNRLILSSEIDKYVVPAQWSIDWWTQYEPSFKTKLTLWPAGVKDLGSFGNRKGKCLLYQKTVPEALVSSVVETLNQKGIEFHRLVYGSFKQEEYFSHLKESSFVIYLTEHESQGLAIHEAWMANVPTLVWEPGILQYQGRVLHLEKLSAPYLSPESGMHFKDKNSFEETLEVFLKKLPEFQPREYSLKNFTNKISAEKYLKILN